MAKYAIEHWTRIPCEVELASEFRYRDPIVGPTTLVVAISQSGETADTLMAIRHAREQRARVLAICNTNGSTIPRESDAVIYTHAGPEIGVASTKGFLTQLVACYLLGLYLAQVRGTKFGDEIARADARAGRRCPAAITAVLDGIEPVLKLAADFADEPSVLFLGRHVGYPVALEGALKLKELAYIHAEGFAAGELKHGPIALIEDRLPVFVVDAAQRPRPAARQGGLQHPGDPGPRRADDRAGRGGRRRGRAVRRRADHACPRCRRCCSRWWRPCRCRCSPASWPPARATTSTSRATWPSRSRSSELGATATPARSRRAVDDRRGRHRRLRRASGSPSRSSGTPRMVQRLFTPAEAERPVASLAARFAAKEALAKALGAPRGCPGTMPRCVTDAARPARLRGHRHGRRPGRASSGSAPSTSRLSHDAGIASAVVVCEA